MRSRKEEPGLLSCLRLFVAHRAGCHEPATAKVVIDYTRLINRRIFGQTLEEVRKISTQKLAPCLVKDGPRTVDNHHNMIRTGSHLAVRRRILRIIETSEGSLQLQTGLDLCLVEAVPVSLHYGWIEDGGFGRDRFNLSSRIEFVRIDVASADDVGLLQPDLAPGDQLSHVDTEPAKRRRTALRFPLRGD